MTEIHETLQKISNDISTIKLDIQLIKNKIGIMEAQTDAMVEHIDFVNGVYEKVKSPFHYLCDKASSMIGTNNISSNNNLINYSKDSTIVKID